jgi:outer membrane protein assembly factor BamD (BamD/ComL family)
MRHPRSFVATVALAALAVTSLSGQAPGTPEEFARRQFESGLEFLRTGRATEALKDFRAVVESYPATSVADDALLAIARYELEVQRDYDAAQATAESLLKKFPSSDSVGMAYVIAGQAMVAQSMTPANVDAALASFERVPRLFAGTEAVAPALFAAGDTLRRLDRCVEALNRFMRVEMEYPRTRWASLARVSGASCETTAGRPIDALAMLQRAIDANPAGPDAAAARALNTILYRLYVRAPALPAWTASERVIAGPGGRLRDVHGLFVGTDGLLFVGHKTGVVVLDPKGTAVRSLSAAAEARAMFVDARNRVLIAQRAVLQPEGGTGTGPSLVTLTVPRDGAQTRIVDDIAAVAVLSSGDRLVADRGQRAVYRFDADGKYLASFATGRISRIAVGPSDEVALLDRDQKQVALVDRGGKALGRIAGKGAGWALDSPADLAFDAFGHVYVLDRTSVLVFARDGRLVTTFTPQAASPGAFRSGGALAVDGAGRLYVYDERAERVQVYQ